MKHLRYYTRVGILRTDSLKPFPRKPWVLVMFCDHSWICVDAIHQLNHCDIDTILHVVTLLSENRIKTDNRDDAREMAAFYGHNIIESK